MAPRRCLFYHRRRPSHGMAERTAQTVLLRISFVNNNILNDDYVLEASPRQWYAKVLCADIFIRAISTTDISLLASPFYISTVRSFQHQSNTYI